MALLLGAAFPLSAQNPQPPAEPPPAAPSGEPLPPPRGQVLIQSHGEPPALAGEPGTAAVTAEPQQPISDQAAKADLSDADRSALLITSYDLDARLRPADAGLAVRAQLTVQNTGATPLKQLALQISSSLRWEGASLLGPTGPTVLAVAQHRLDTDADHTGAETELILNLPEALAPGASGRLDLFYDGTVPASAARLQRLGANAAQQQSTDWDAISPSWTGMRGFGNVLWYPVASPQLFLAEGNALFQAVGHTRLREQEANIRLRLSVEYSGEPPVAAYFCGRRQIFSSISDTPNSATAAGTGLATATFGAEPLGFRTPSLFLLRQPEVFADPPGVPATTPAATSAAGATAASGVSTDPMAATNAVAAADPAATTSAPPSGNPSASAASPSYSSSAGPQPEASVLPLLRRGGGLGEHATPFLALEGADGETIQNFSAAAYRSSAILREWLGPQPLTALTGLEHEGQPFEDGPLLVAPLGVLAASTESPALTQSLTHAWVQTGQPWMDEGLPQFFALLAVERSAGRETAVAQLTELMKPVAFGEPDPTSTAAAPSAEPLIAASSDLIYRRKAAAVWWMLRGIVGDGNLHAALSAWCTQPVSTDPPEAQAVAFQHLLERLSHQDLAWFFADWVLHDKGLPDLSITDVTAVEEPTRPGHAAGWLVATTVRNEGGAVADVPIVIRAGTLSVTRRMRIAGQASVTERVLVEASPNAVIVNNGDTPEQRVATHTSEIHVRGGDTPQKTGPQP